MAKHTVAAGQVGAQNKTLVASTVDSVAFADDPSYVHVLSDGAARIYVTTDGSEPTVGGANTYPLPAIPCERRIPHGGSGQAVKLISDGTPVYSVLAGGSELALGGAAAAAAAATTHAITAKLATDKIQDGLTALTPKFAVIDHATSGNNTIVAAVTGKKIRVLAYNAIAAGTVLARFESGADGTALTGQKSLVANSGLVAPFCPVGWFETAAGALLNLELSAGVSVDGELVYVEV